MKSYEQMTKDVLKRRDEELKASNKFSKAIKVIVPCASAAAGVAVIFGVGALVSSGGYRNAIATPNSSNSANSTAITTINPSSSNELVDIAMEDQNKLDFTNPKSGQSSKEINVIIVDKFNLEQNISLNENEFNEYPMEQLCGLYGLEFDRLTKLHSDWTESHEPLGVYRSYFSEGGAAGMSMTVFNTLNYTTDTGAKISVSAKFGKFDPITDTLNKSFAEDKPYTPTVSKPINEYDENGNLIAQMSPGYDPTKDTNRPTNDEGVFMINGYDVYMYREGDTNKFAADINMGTRVRFVAEGLTTQEFYDIIDEYTR